MKIPTGSKKSSIEKDTESNCKKKEILEEMIQYRKGQTTIYKTYT
jgi:hypothetical protein